MNKIIIEKNKVKNYKNNKIVFTENGEYELEIIDCSNINYSIVLEDNVYVKLFIYSEDNVIDIDNHIVLNNNSNLLLFKFYSNNIVNEKLIVDLNKEYAKINYCFSNVCCNKENYHLIINHNASNTISNISNKSITINNAYLDYTIDSIVPKNVKNSILNQSTKVITMDKNNVTIRPNMYIDKYDVEAKHSSTIGRFNDEDIFYLNTRGIDKNTAIQLLVKGFIFSDLLVSLEYRARILNIINSKWR